MQEFAVLCARLESTTQDSERISLLKEYFARSSSEDMAWSIFFLSGKRSKAQLKVAQLRRWIQEHIEIDDWLFDECYTEVSDLCETIALLIQERVPTDSSKPACNTDALSAWMNHINEEIFSTTEEAQRIFVIESWQQLSDTARVIFNKIITGTIRSPISEQILIEALSQYSGINRRVMSQRLAIEFQPEKEFVESLFNKTIVETASFHTVSFIKMQAASYQRVEEMPVQSWLVDWNWDGIRAQLIKNEDQISLWSDEDQLLSKVFPELISEANALSNGTTIEGVIVAWKDADVLPFETLKQRLSRKNITSKLKEDAPVVFMAQDLLESSGQDLRDLPFEKRRALLADVLSNRSQTPDERSFQQLQLFAPCKAQLSQILRHSAPFEPVDNNNLKDLLKTSRQINADGIILRQRDASYGIESSLLVCHAEPLTVTAVLVAAQAANDNRRRIFDDYTFAIWKNDELVPFVRTRADAEAGESTEKQAELSPEEIKNIDSFVRKNTLERFGPVCTVKPQLVFELSCRAIQRSNRNKAGITVRFPRIIKMKSDKSPEDADKLETVLQQLQ